MDNGILNDQSPYLDETGARILYRAFLDMDIPAAKGYHRLFEAVTKDHIADLVRSIFVHSPQEALADAKKQKEKATTTSLDSAWNDAISNHHIFPPLLRSYLTRLAVTKDITAPTSPDVLSYMNKREDLLRTSVESIALRDTQLSERFPVEMVATEIHKFLKRVITPPNLPDLCKTFARSVSEKEFVQIVDLVNRHAMNQQQLAQGDIEAAERMDAFLQEVKPKLTKIFTAMEKMLVKYRFIPPTPVMPIPEDNEPIQLSASRDLVVK